MRLVWSTDAAGFCPLLTGFHCDYQLPSFLSGHRRYRQRSSARRKRYSDSTPAFYAVSGTWRGIGSHGRPPSPCLPSTELSIYSTANSVKVCWKKSPVHVINLPALSQPHPSVFLLHTCLSDDDDIASCFVKPPSRSILNLIYTHDAACDTKSKQSGQAGQIKQTVSRHPRSGPASTYCRTP